MVLSCACASKSLTQTSLFKPLTLVEAITGNINSSCWLGLDILSSTDNGEVLLRSSPIDNCLFSSSACEVLCSIFFASNDERLALLFSFALEGLLSVSSSVSKHSE